MSTYTNTGRLSALVLRVAVLGVSGHDGGDLNREPLWLTSESSEETLEDTTL